MCMHMYTKEHAYHQSYRFFFLCMYIYKYIRSYKSTRRAIPIHTCYSHVTFSVHRWTSSASLPRSGGALLIHTSLFVFTGGRALHLCGPRPVSCVCRALSPTCIALTASLPSVSAPVATYCRHPYSHLLVCIHRWTSSASLRPWRPSRPSHSTETSRRSSAR